MTTGFALVISLGILTSVVGALQMRRLAASVDEVANDRMVKADQFSALLTNLYVAQIYIRNAVISQDPSFRDAEIKKLMALRAENTKLLENLQKSVALPREREPLKTINDTRPPYNQVIRRVHGKATASSKLSGRSRD